MRVGFFGCQQLEHTARGMMTVVDGRGYSRKGTKVSRRKATALVEAGVPLVLDGLARDREWLDGDDARQVWEELRRYVITSEPASKQLAKHEMWNAGLWTAADDRQLLYLNGRC